MSQWHYVSTQPVVMPQFGARQIRVAVLVRGTTAKPKNKFTTMVSFPAFLTGGKLPSHREAVAYLKHAKPF